MASTIDGMKAKMQSKETAWCGFESLLGSHVCNLELSPFQKAYVGVKGGNGCTVTSEAAFSYVMLVAELLGMAIFFGAPLLSASMVFRVSCGTLTFTLGSLVILLFILFRMVPHKRQVVAVAATIGSGSMALLRWLTGHWLPSLHQLLHNRFFAAYIVLSALVGAAVTYLYDDCSNPKVNTLIKIGLRILGLFLVYLGTWTLFPLSAALISVLIVSVISPGLAEQQRRRKAKQPQHAYDSAATPAAVAYDGTPLRSILKTGHPQPNSVTPRGAAYASPLHLREGPPAPWTIQPKPQKVWTFEEKQAALQQRTPGSARRAAATAQHATPASDKRVQDNQGQIHPLIKSGMILNPVTGRTIRIGYDTYNRLLEQGYVADESRGMLTPPRTSKAGDSPTPTRRSAGKRSVG